MKMEKEVAYEAPDVEMVSVAVEAGYEDSPQVPGWDPKDEPPY